jgi:glyceraldehyde-3-phosphate dehydrogenase (NADP+)
MSKTIFIGNQFFDSDIKDSVIDPFTNKVIKEISLATEKQADEALLMAQRAFIISKTEPSFVRKKRLLKLALEVAKNKDILAKLISIESAKPIRLAKAEVERALITLKEAAEESTRIDGEYIDLEIDKNLQNTKAIVKYESMGVVYSISPFNFPLNLMIHKIAPALAIGNPVIIKPPKQTPLTAIKFAEIIQELDFPRGLVQVLPSDNNVAKKIIESDVVKIVSFTGSDEVGDIISKLAYNKKVLLELGGIATMVVDKTADLKLAANRAAVGAFAYAGQICISVQRIFVHKDVYMRFKTLFLEESRNIKTGTPLDESVLCSSLIDAVGVKKFNRFYHDAVVKKADILLEPEIKDNLISPTIIESKEDNLLLNSEEAFSPIVLLREYDIFEEVVGLINNNKYGLQAAIFSDSLNLINKAAEKFEVGGIIVNDYPTFRTDKQPYGGIKASGRGREGLKYAIREFAEMKTIIFRNFQ